MTAIDAPLPEGVDRAQLAALLRAIFRVRTRSRMRFGRTGRPRGLIFQIILYGVMGGLTGMIAFLKVDVFTYCTVLGALTLFISGSTMVAESSQLLFSPDEHDILGHRPITPRTLLLARSLALFGLTAMITLSLNLAPMFFGLWIEGARPWFPIVYMLSMLLIALFCAGSVVFVYVLLTKLVGRERFDSFASWLQLGISIAFILGYQIIPRMIERANGVHLSPAAHWVGLLPPAWFAALVTLAAGSPSDKSAPVLLPMVATGVIVTFAIAWAAIVKLSSDYARGLARLQETTMRRPARVAKVSKAGSRAGVFMPLGRMLMPDPVEWESFQLAAAYMRRDRDVRMRLYPSLATYVVFPIIAFIDPAKGAYLPVITIVLAAMLPASCMMTLKMSPQFAASDVFRFAPIRSTAPVFHGVRKAALLFMTLPVLLVSATLLWFALRDHTWLIATLPALVLVPTLSLVEGLAGDYLPLSIPPVTGRQSAMLIGLYAMSAVLAGGISALGWYARKHGWFWPLLGVELVAVAGVHALLLKGIRARTISPLT
jgi:hypothetical protein